MDVKHAAGGEMEITLSREDIIMLNRGDNCEDSRAEGDLSTPLVFLVADEYCTEDEARARLYDGYVGVYVPLAAFRYRAVKNAVIDKKPITKIVHENIDSSSYSADTVDGVFGQTGGIVIKGSQELRDFRRF